MLLFIASQAGQPDYVALAMFLVLILIVAVMALRKRFAPQKPAEASDPVPEAESPTPAAPGSAGQLKLHDVPPKTAALLMAIVADKTGRPLNELRFISIKEVKET